LGKTRLGNGLRGIACVPDEIVEIPPLEIGTLKDGVELAGEEIGSIVGLQAESNGTPDDGRR